MKAYLGLGSNIGDLQSNLRRAVGMLASRVKVISLSSIYETEPVGITQQPKFLNCVCGIETQLSPRQLLQVTKEVETSMGRQEGPPWGPRVIDVDILFYGRLVVKEHDLKIPHPRLHQRAFVLVPLAEIAPRAVHPILGVTVKTLLKRLSSSAGVEWYASYERLLVSSRALNSTQ